VDLLIDHPSPEANEAVASSLHKLSNQLPTTSAQILDVVNQKWTDTRQNVNNHLGALLQTLFEQGTVSKGLAVELLDRSVLQETNCITSSQILSTRSVRINTGLLYKQQKFNLLREDNEGYAKLSHELNLALSELPKKGKFDPEVMRIRCGDLLTVINALIGYFELDPNRVLDNVLDVCSQNLLSHTTFILGFLHRSPWAPSQIATSIPFTALDDGEKRDRLDLLQKDFLGFYGTEIQKEGGSKVAAKLLGFKLRAFASISTLDDKMASPESLIFLIALLLKSGFINFSDIYPYV
jgi:THO complex subunit 2